MTTKDFLNKGYKLSKEISILKKAYKKALTAAEYTSPNFCKEKSTDKSGDNNNEKRVVNTNYLAKNIETRIKNLTKIQNELVNVIYKLDSSLERTILIQRYLLFYKWERIADNAGFEVRNIYNIHNRALQHISDILQEK